METCPLGMLGRYAIEACNVIELVELTGYTTLDNEAIAVLSISCSDIQTLNFSQRERSTPSIGITRKSQTQAFVVCCVVLFLGATMISESMSKST